MSDAMLTMPPGGWTIDDLDRLPETHLRYELTDGALTVSPSPSSLHQAIAGILMTRLDQLAPSAYAVTGAVEIRFTRRLTRIPDVLIVRTNDPRRHWFAPDEVVVAVEVESPGSHIEDRTTKPALYAQYGIPHYWRIEPEPLRVTTYRLGPGDAYAADSTGDRLSVDEPFTVSLPLVALLPSWSR